MLTNYPLCGVPSLLDKQGGRGLEESELRPEVLQEDA